MRFPLAICASGSAQQYCEENAKNVSHLQEMQEIPLTVSLTAPRVVFLALHLHPAHYTELNKPGFLPSISQHLHLQPSPSSSTLIKHLSSDLPLPLWGILRAMAQAESGGKPLFGSSTETAVTKLCAAEWHCLCQGWALCSQLNIS